MFCWSGYKMSDRGEEDSDRFDGGRLRGKAGELKRRQQGGEVAKGLGE